MEPRLMEKAVKSNYVPELVKINWQRFELGAGSGEKQIQVAFKIVL